jgi:phosphomannomutase
MLDKIARENGLTAIETPVGFKYIGACMREKAA